MSDFRVPFGPSETEFTEKRSRFIGHLLPVETEEQAREFIAQMKKKYYDARHNCWCYLLREGGVLFAPAKAANAGGVATSGLEMSQNSERLSWSFEEVDAKLKGIMEGIFHASYDASVAAGSEGNLMVGANCAGFLKVATAMMAQGITY